jgi:dTDP-4-dehydrorhamnose 3,5-epimerase-like enzyme
MGVYVPAGTWRAITNYSTNAVAVIAASTHYDPNDAIRDYDEFRSWLTNERENELMNEGANETNTIHQSTINNQHYSVYDCGIITLDRHHSQRKGDISVIENGESIPFDVKRIYYLYDVPGGESRGGHAHKELQQLILAASGSFTVTLDDGNVKRSYTLNRPYQGLLVKPGIWRTLDDFSSGSVCLVLASEKYDAEDYIRDYSEFLEYRK